MTTTVRKGAGRAEAKAKREKHAQRTALPDNLDSLGLPELKQFARANGWSTLVDRGTKPQIVQLLQEHPGGPPAGMKPLGDNGNGKSNGNGKKPEPSRKEVKVESPDALTAAHNEAREIAQRIANARDRGFSRRDISDASGFTQSVIWRMQGKAVVKPHERKSIVDTLDKIESGEIQPTPRGRPRGSVSRGSATRAALQSKLDDVHAALSEVPMNSNKPSEYREAITKALDIIDDNA